MALTQVRRLLRAGRVSFIDVLDAQRTLSADQIAVFLALGGGWTR